MLERSLVLVPILCVPRISFEYNYLLVDTLEQNQYYRNFFITRAWIPSGSGVSLIHICILWEILISVVRKGDYGNKGQI